MDEESKKELVGEEKEGINIIRRLKAYIFCGLCSLFYAAFHIIVKLCLDKGMSKYVLVVYGYAVGTATTALLALLFERKLESKLSLSICLKIFLLGLIGVVGRLLFYFGLESTSPTFAAAMNNIIPSMTFILAIICRMEKINIKKLTSQAKIGGTIVAFGGATLMTVYKGFTVVSMHALHTTKHGATPKLLLYSHLIKGSLLLILQCLLAAVYYVLQAKTVEKYPAPFTLTVLTCLSGTLISAILALIIDHKISSWKLALDITLVTPIYSGIVIFGIATYVQTLVMRTRGPVFVTAFRPFTTVIVAILGLLILGDALHLGGILGATLIVLGLYALLWAKEVESERKKLAKPAIPDEKIQIKSEN
ncbi:WAT1-related protein At5g07050-like [Mercurialis annua]|uniref:WAT1-related protein At5g07050-like n=1 Tax=Mercurialis annua TaxID=3986 RepID=UPI00215F554A|nr:WAT1-related protein At5g07050-like [Mercurialis annua]